MRQSISHPTLSFSHKHPLMQYKMCECNVMEAFYCCVQALTALASLSDPEHGAVPTVLNSTMFLAFKAPLIYLWPLWPNNSKHLSHLTKNDLQRSFSLSTNSVSAVEHVCLMLLSEEEEKVISFFRALRGTHLYVMFWLPCVPLL